MECSNKAVYSILIWKIFKKSTVLEIIWHLKLKYYEAYPQMCLKIDTVRDTERSSTYTSKISNSNPPIMRAGCTAATANESKVSLGCVRTHVQCMCINAHTKQRYCIKWIVFAGFSFSLFGVSVNILILDRWVIDPQELNNLKNHCEYRI